MIISATRRTDIPAFYSTWFMNRLKEGFVLVRNPMNPNAVSRVDLSPEVVDCIVFWTKNPTPMLSKLKELKDYMYYFQYTLNGYPNNIEIELTSLEDRINTFKELSHAIGKERVIWRYDPILLTDKIDIKYHKTVFEYIARSLNGYTNRVMVGVLDNYRKITSSMKLINNRTLSDDELQEIMISMKEISEKYGMEIQSCYEKIDLNKYGIHPGKCVDDEIISSITGNKFIYEKDKNQKSECKCIISADIGSYNSCPHFCKYCYANDSKEIVDNIIRKHNPNSPFLIGDSMDGDIIRVRKDIIKTQSGQQISLL